MILQCIKCSKQLSDFSGSITLKLTKGKFITNIFCPDCGSPLEQIQNKEFEEISFSVGTFNSLSDSEKKRVLRERAKNHFNKFDKKEVENKRRRTIEEMKQKVKDNT